MFHLGLKRFIMKEEILSSKLYREELKFVSGVDSNIEVVIILQTELSMGL